MPIAIAERLVAAAVLICSLVVGYLTIHHGDVPLGLMVLLGQAQSIISHHSHDIGHEAAHLVIHKNK